MICTRVFVPRLVLQNAEMSKLHLVDLSLAELMIVTYEK